MRRLFCLLVVVVFLLAGCPADTGAPTTGETAVTPAAEEALETPEAVEEVDTPEVTETEGITETEEITETEGVTETEGITETEEMETPEAAEEMETPEVTETEGITETEEITGTEEMTGTGMVGGEMATINVGDDDSLTDAEGTHYYTFTGTEEPADLGDFERVEASGADTVGEGLDEMMLGTLDVDGTSQLTYNGLPLYRYTGDGEPPADSGFAHITSTGELAAE